MVPLLFWAFPHCGVREDLSVPLALGTSLASAACFTLSGALAHWKRGMVQGRRIPLLITGGVIGAIAGSTLATWAGGPIVKRLFSALLVFAAYRLAFSKSEKAPPCKSRKSREKTLFFLIGLATGLVGSFFGVGGGIVAVPLMILVFCFAPLEAVATSSAIIPAIAGMGAVSYAFHGWGKVGLPPWSLGYVNIIAWASLVSGGIISSQLGVWVGHKMGSLYLKRAFSVLLFAIAFKLIKG